MKLFGYNYLDENHQDLAEISLVATPDELRKIASFLNEAANNMEKMGDKYDHEHLSDKKKNFNNSPHFVVVSALKYL